jgi:anti-anti-sigma factor
MDAGDLRGTGIAGAADAAARGFAALDDAPTAIAVLAPARDDHGAVADLVVEYANGAAAAIAGVAVEELPGRGIRAALAPEHFERLAAVVDDGAPMRARLDRDDGLAGPGPPGGRFEVSASRIGGLLLVACEDLGARTRDEIAERRFGAVLEDTSDWVSLADADARFIYLNAGGRRMVGLDPDADVVGMRVGQFSPTWARERYRNEALAVARREGVWRGNLARLHRDGHEIPVSQVVVAHTDEHGEVEFFATIARDMTQERAAEAALRRSEERFRTAFEQAPIGMSLVGLDGRFVQVNDAYCATVRRSREELLAGLGPTEITHPDDVPYTREAFRVLLAGEASVLRWEKRYVDPAGETIWVEISATVFRDAEGRPQFLNGMLQDLSERRVAHTLQRSMLTTQLPVVDDVELAVRYLPSGSDAEVGGDWYDVIPLPGGRVGLAIGDVVGRGIEAAATMSQLRTALRSYAVEGLDPAAVVAKLHRLVGHLRVGFSTTLAYLDLDPFTLELRYVSAGHLPVLLSPAAGVPRYLEGARAAPLGASPLHRPIPQERLQLAPGDTLLLYTDGLVERRDVDIDTRLEELRAAMRTAPEDLDARLQLLTTALAGGATRTDDVALLAVRANGPAPGSFARTIPGEREHLRALRGDLRTWLTAAGATADECGDVLVAVGEACANAIEHGGAGPDATVDLRARIAGGELVVSVDDRGTWRTTRPPADRGHGLRLMRVLADRVTVGTAQNGTRVELRFALARGAPPPPAERAPPAPAEAAAVAHERIGEVPVARMRGEVDLGRIDELATAVAAAVGPRDRGLVLDLSAVQYLDSAGIHGVHELGRTLGERGQQLRVVAEPGARVLRLIELVDLAGTLPLHDSVAAAVAALTPPAPSQ